jgi:hypothetical protein
MVLKGLTAAFVALALSLPVALAAPTARVSPGQRIDLKVLLLSADGNEPGFAAWKAELEREGVPFDTLVAYSGQTRAATLTDATLADYASEHARYQAVILATGDLVHQVTNANGTLSYLSALTDAEWATLSKFERTFGIRRLSDYTAATAAHGLAPAVGAPQDGVVGQLTPAGRAAFPYLKGPVAIADDDPATAETFGYPAKVDPANPGAWQTLLAGPADTAFLGIFTHPDDGREEMVMTVASNQFQNHNQLLRHGMLNWVTRGVFLGYQRNYLELQVDDLFLGDDAWDSATHSTSYDPALASRMTPADVDHAIAWSRARGLRLDMAFNGGGSALEAQQTLRADALADKFADPAVRNAFGYVNHTLDHPNLDCSTASFIANQIRSNLAWADAHGLPLANRSEVVTGEHSGLANSRPGNPGTIDPPTFDSVEPQATGGTLLAGTYDYALTARSPAGETIGSVVAGTVVGAAASTTNAVTVSFNAVCHATGYDVYRRSAGTAAWARVGTLARAADAPTDDGTQPIQLTFTDTGAAGAAATPPATNGAALAPYPQNPNLVAGLAAAGIRTIASDASKGYPSTPNVITSPLLLPGATWTQGAVRAVPRYPSNVYYNVSHQAQQLDEYNWIYVAPANGGGCVPITGVTTCRTTLATWGDYVTSETRVMFRHLTGNDPRPHFFHQSNLADFNPALPETDPNQGGILYPVIGTLVDRYAAAYNGALPAGEPLVQLTTAEIADVLARQDAWTAAKPSVSAWLQDGRVYVRNGGTAAVNVPLTGTTVGEPYSGQRSGWVSIAAGAQVDYAPADPASASPPVITGTARVGDKLTAAPGTWTGTPQIGYAQQWQRCDAAGAVCKNLAGATEASYAPTAADEGSKLRVAVLAGSWISSVSQAFSAPTAVVAPKPVTARNDTSGPGGKSKTDGRPGTGGSPTGRPGSSATLRLTRVKMSPRRFLVAHRRAIKGTRLDGARVSWRLNRAATVKLTFQRHTRRGWVRVGVITRAAKAGNGELRFRGRFGNHLLKPQRYRLMVAATQGRERTAARHIGFRVLKG